VMHMNGRADRGDGSGKCGACHGTGDDPWPATGAHAKHKAPMNAVAIGCETCHPAIGGDHPRGGPAVVKLTGLAASGGRSPTFDATAKTCANVYCHDGAGGSLRTPKWSDTISCGGCHSSPPPAPHTPSTECGTTCHVQPRATTHVNGRIEL
jgi:predicted CxxxxCH...CXXCH cytochrome family protein